MADGRRIIVRSSYDDGYKLRLWRAVIDDTQRFRGGKKKLGAQRYYFDVILPVVGNWSGSIYLDDETKPYNLPLPEIDPENPRQISRFLEADPKARGFPKNVLSTDITRIFDAYLKVTNPPLAGTLQGYQSTEVSGETVAHFMKDKTLYTSRHDVSAIFQNTIGVYEYDQTDVLRKKTGISRFFTLIESRSLAFMLAVDFHWDVEGDVVFIGDEQLDLYFGFLVPGRRFSFLVMRSLNFRYRQTGLVYTSKGLVQYEHLPVDELNLDTMTTDDDVIDIDRSYSPAQKFREGDKESVSDWAAKLAMLQMSGPRTSKLISNITGTPRANAVLRRVGKIERDYI